MKVGHVSAHLLLAGVLVVDDAVNTLVQADGEAPLAAMTSSGTQK